MARLFFRLFDKFRIEPAEACMAFGLNVPGVESIALDTSNAKRAKGSIAIANVSMCEGFFRGTESLGVNRRKLYFIEIKTSTDI